MIGKDEKGCQQAAFIIDLEIYYAVSGPSF